MSEYTDAYFAGDWDVAFTKLWSQRCQMDNDERNSFLGTLMAQEVNYPDPARRPRAANIRVDRLEGETAIVTYDYESGTESGTVSSQPWRLEAGEWRFDGC